MGVTPTFLVLYYKQARNMSKARHIIQQYFNNMYPDSVREDFAAWLSDERDSREKDAALRDVWDKLEGKADRSTIDSYNKLLRRIGLTAHEKRTYHFSFRKISRIAALFLLPLLSVAITYFYVKNDIQVSGDMQLVECIVPNGETRKVVLPDSSTVLLNSGSILIYPKCFGHTRGVYLNGEAYFAVVHKQERPFTVRTADLEVNVLGTIFNISSYADGETSSATLESGKVSVRFRNHPDKSLLLAPNEQITYNRQTESVEKRVVNVENTIAWTEGNLVIQQMTIYEIAKTIERKFNMKVFINSNKYENERITMKCVNDETITDFMNVLRYLIPQLKYKIEGDKMYIY